MAHPSVTTAVNARLAANWNLTRILKLNEETQTPGEGSPWVRVEFPVSRNSKPILGRYGRESGGFRIAVATEIGSGLTKSNDYCEQIAAIFNDITFAGVECRDASINEGRDDGSYFIASVIVPYFFNYQRG